MSASTVCSLCNDDTGSVYYNLEKSYTLYSNTLLLKLFHDSIDKDYLSESEHICKKCYALLNELDNIQLRADSIINQLRIYITQSSNGSNSNGSVSQEQGLEIKPDNDDNNDLSDDGKVDEYDDNDSSPSTNKANDKKRKRSKTKKSPVKGAASSAVPKLHQCTVCSKSWKTPGELKCHMRSHITERPYICEICGQGYKRKAALAIHVGMHNGINPFTCVRCNKSFTQKGALMRHMPIHTGELPFQCDLCGKRFIHHTSFNIHRISHTGEKSYKCKVCGLALMSCSHLKRHMRVHTGEKNNSCGVCGKRFAEKYNLATHEKLHLNDDGVSSTKAKRKYRCQVCNVFFERKLKLEEHLTNDHQKIKLELENDATK